MKKLGKIKRGESFLEGMKELRNSYYYFESI